MQTAVGMDMASRGQTRRMGETPETEGQADMARLPCEPFSPQRPPCHVNEK